MASSTSNAPNRLQHEKSPYLLQHIHNPVDWYPWGEEAFAKAKAEDKPIFLSIGYSTCHWCHVMAHESFEDAEVAQVLNSDFIAIKVDREERPDIDAVYMSVCQALTGSGGWPLTIIMTPEQKPFFAGTYFPKNTRYGTKGLLQLLKTIAQQWIADRENITASSEEITAFLQKQDQTHGKPLEPTNDMITKAVQLFQQNFDKRWGGFSPAPKFPTPHHILFLLQYHALTNDQPALKSAEHTLTQMYQGGLFDHIGGGFSRYATDQRWLIPHFEKMLYDNALLTYAYLQAFQVTNHPLYAQVAKRTIKYVLRELTDDKGGFYCGQDADSEGIEGKYYVWTSAEIRQVLGAHDGAIFCQQYDITEQGNFEGKSIPNLLDRQMIKHNDQLMGSLFEKLYAYRLQRTALHKDDKILTSWNSLMIMSLAKASHVLDHPGYLTAAKAGQQFIATELTNDQGRLLVRWRHGHAAHAGQLDDYAFYALALLELYQVTFDVSYLQEAIAMTEIMLALFWDEQNGGFYLYAKDSEQLISRPKEVYDGAMPSGNSAAARVLVQLSALTGEIRWQDLCHRQLCFVASVADHYPAGYSFALLAMMDVLYPSQQLICALATNDVPRELPTLLRQHHLPTLTILLKTPDNQQQLATMAPFTTNYPLPEIGATYYLCQNGACSAPVTTLTQLLEQLQTLPNPMV